MRSTVTTTPLVILTLAGLLHAEDAGREFVLGHLVPEPGPVIYAEVKDLDRVIHEIKVADFVSVLRSLPGYEEFLRSNDGRRLLAVLQIAETYLGRDAWNTVSELVGDRVAIALLHRKDEPRPDGLLAIRFQDQTLLNHYRRRVEPFLDLIPQSWTSEDSDGMTVWSVGKQLHVGINNRWLILSSNKQICLSALQRADSKAEPQEPHARFEALTGSASAQVNSSRILTAAIDLEWLRAATKQQIPQRMDNALGSLLFGHMPRVLQQSARTTITVDSSTEELVVRARLHGVEFQDSPWQVFALRQEILSIPALPELVGGVSLSRRFSDWYGARENLMENRSLPAFDKFETGLGNLLPGRDFEQDVLPLFGPRIAVLAARQTFDHLDGTPGIKLPAFGLIIEMAKPEQAADLLTLFFQTLSAILNIQAGQEGRQPWIMSSETYQDVQLTFARYLRRPEGERLPIVFNFMPASARVGDFYLLATSKQMCRDLVDYVRMHPELPTEDTTETHLELHAETIQDLVEINSEPLKAQSLREGRTIQEADRNLALARDIIGLLKSFSVSARQSNQAMDFELRGVWK